MSQNKSIQAHSTFQNSQRKLLRFDSEYEGEAPLLTEEQPGNDSLEGNPWNTSVQFDPVTSQSVKPVLSSLFLINREISRFPQLAFEEKLTWKSLSKDILSPYAPRSKLLQRHITFRLPGAQPLESSQTLSVASYGGESQPRLQSFQSLCTPSEKLLSVQRLRRKLQKSKSQAHGAISLITSHTFSGGLAPAAGSVGAGSVGARRRADSTAERSAVLYAVPHGERFCRRKSCEGIQFGLRSGYEQRTQDLQVEIEEHRRRRRLNEIIKPLQQKSLFNGRFRKLKSSILDEQTKERLAEEESRLATQRSELEGAQEVIREADSRRSSRTSLPRPVPGESASKTPLRELPTQEVTLTHEFASAKSKASTRSGRSLRNPAVYSFGAHKMPSFSPLKASRATVPQPDSQRRSPVPPEKPPNKKKKLQRQTKEILAQQSYESYYGLLNHRQNPREANFDLHINPPVNKFILNQNLLRDLKPKEPKTERKNQRKDVFFCLSKRRQSDPKHKWNTDHSLTTLPNISFRGLQA